MDTFLFDIGNVIMHFDFTHAGIRMAKSCTAEGDPIKLLAPLKQKLESGQIEGPEFVTKGIDAVGFQGTSDEVVRHNSINLRKMTSKGVLRTLKICALAASQRNPTEVQGHRFAGVRY